MKYTPLHVHSTYSLLDGLSQPEQIADRIREIGSTACAITDHGSIGGAIDFFQSMKGDKEEGTEDIKPILGCELYITQDGKSAKDKSPENKKLVHQVVLAKNLDGWRELLKLVSTSNKPEHVYYKPRLDLDLIRSIQPRNLITFSGHPGSTLADVLKKDDWEDAGFKYVREMQDIFGEENFFLEVQLIVPDEYCKKLAEKVRRISELTGVKCIATPDAHYCRKSDAEDQHVLLSSNFGKSIPQIKEDLNKGEAKSLSCFFQYDIFHIPTYEEMIEFGNTPEELENTNLVADMIEEYNILSNPKLPSFDCPNKMDDNDYLRQLCRQGWRNKLSKIDKNDKRFPEYGTRVQHELEIFTGYNLSSYFLIVQDILNFLKKKNYLVGPGRGSAAGCMVSYLLGIVQIDPIEHDLLFERFFNAGRLSEGHVSLPDIDVDVPKQARSEVLEYLREKYGEDNVGQILTYQTMQGKAALKRVMMAHGNIPAKEQNVITSPIPDKAKVEDELKQMKKETGSESLIQWCLENIPDKFRDWCEIKDGELVGKYKDIFAQAIRLEKTKIYSSRHAAGIIISSSPISDLCPMVIDKEGKHLIAGFEGPSCEAVGLVKLDILGITMLDKIMGACKLLLKRKNNEKQQLLSCV